MVKFLSQGVISEAKNLRVLSSMQRRVSNVFRLILSLAFSPAVFVLGSERSLSKATSSPLQPHLIQVPGVDQKSLRFAGVYLFAYGS